MRTLRLASALFVTCVSAVFGTTAHAQEAPAPPPSVRVILRVNDEPPRVYQCRAATRDEARTAAAHPCDHAFCVRGSEVVGGLAGYLVTGGLCNLATGDRAPASCQQVATVLGLATGPAVGYIGDRLCPPDPTPYVGMAPPGGAGGATAASRGIDDVAAVGVHTDPPTLYGSVDPCVGPISCEPEGPNYTPPEPTFTPAEPPEPGGCGGGECGGGGE
jgi:hypothetical protein